MSTISSSAPRARGSSRYVEVARETGVTREGRGESSLERDERVERRETRELED